MVVAKQYPWSFKGTYDGGLQLACPSVYKLLARQANLGWPVIHSGSATAQQDIELDKDPESDIHHLYDFTVSAFHKSFNQNRRSS